MSELRAKVTEEFDGVIDGTVYPRKIAVGEEVTGSLAQTAIDMKVAKETKESKADRTAAQDAAVQEAADRLAAEQAEAARLAKIEEDRAKLALLSHDQLVGLATEHQIDLAGLQAESDIIEAVRSGLDALNVEVPAPPIVSGG